MSTHLVECPVCAGPITADKPGVLCRFTYRRSTPKHQWRRNYRDVLACARCATTPRAGQDGTDNLIMIGLQEFTDTMRPAQCEFCGVALLLRPDSRRKHSTCSTACRMRLYKAARRVPQAVTQCEVCGADMRGRTDKRTCSAACRQKAYRLRYA